VAYPQRCPAFNWENRRKTRKVYVESYILSRSSNVPVIRNIDGFNVPANYYLAVNVADRTRVNLKAGKHAL
jgi:hypothetical protein